MLTLNGSKQVHDLLMSENPSVAIYVHFLKKIKESICIAFYTHSGSVIYRKRQESRG